MESVVMTASSILSFSGKTPFSQEVIVAVVAVVMVIFWLRRASTSNVSAVQEDFTRPPHVRSYIPYVGSALEMGAGITAFVRKYGQEKFQNSPFFTATILGEKYIFIADPEWLSLVFRPSLQKYLDEFTLQRQFMKNAMGMTEEGVKEGFQPAVTKAAHKHYIKYLFRGDALERSLGEVQRFFHRHVPTLCSVGPGGVETPRDWTTHRLYDLVTTAIFKASVEPLISSALVNDDAMNAFRQFDKGTILLFQDAPRFLTRKARAARDILMQYIASKEFWDGASELIHQRRKDFAISEDSLNRANVSAILFISLFDDRMSGR